MANSYHQVHIQAVFAVKFRRAVIDKSWRSQFFGVIGNLIKDTGCKTLIVNGVEDHVHCFFSLLPRLSISDVMQHAKGASSKWLNETGYLDHHFDWQRGYGAFSYSHSHIERVYKYIQNQERHHHKQSFKEEYIEILNQYGIKYDERYLFEDLI